MEDGEYAIFLNGSYGVGKSAVLEPVGDVLAGAEHPFALMDVDWFHRAWPPARTDPHNVRGEAQIIAGAWGVYRSAGPRQRYQRALGMTMRSVRLEAGEQVRSTRLAARYGRDRAAALRWHLQRHQNLAARLAAAGNDELVIATDDLTPHAVAQQVLAYFDLA